MLQRDDQMYLGLHIAKEPERFAGVRARLVVAVQRDMIRRHVAERCRNATHIVASAIGGKRLAGEPERHLRIAPAELRLGEIARDHRRPQVVTARLGARQCLGITRPCSGKVAGAHTRAGEALQHPGAQFASALRSSCRERFG